METPINVDAYIAQFAEPSQKLLRQLRAAIMKAAPNAEEIISYGMPAYRLKWILVYFAGHKNHIGFYPGASAVAAFKNELSEYKWAKGTIQFLPDKPLPVKLIHEIVKYRVSEILQKAASKGITLK
jgi:uncharacterized protein YdhG (YjbR/CyaY superfamily)